MKNIKTELAKTVELCRNLEGAKTRLFFSLGEQVMAIATKWNYRPTGSDGVALTDAIDAVRQHLLAASQAEAFAAPPCANLYWYTAARAWRELTPLQRDKLIKHNASWTQIVRLWPRSRKEINAIIAAVDARHPLKVRIRKVAVNSPHHYVTQDEVAVKSCVVTDTDDEDSLQAKLDYLLSLLRKKGLDYRRMVLESLERVKRME